MIDAEDDDTGPFVEVTEEDVTIVGAMVVGNTGGSIEEDGTGVPSITATTVVVGRTRRGSTVVDTAMGAVVQGLGVDVT